MFGLAFYFSYNINYFRTFLVFGLGSLAAIALNALVSLIQVSFGALTKHVLIAVPLFIFTGMAMLKGGLLSKISQVYNNTIGHWPGVRVSLWLLRWGSCSFVDPYGNHAVEQL